tara:strand:- start:2282 stop:2587 length:306 start_codon:yes stop_codon:yes gene_type:complete
MSNKVTCTPAIVRVRGKTFVAAGFLEEAWDGITMQEVSQLFPLAKFVPSPATEQETKEYQVLSSKGDKSYTVTYRNDSYSCSCPGYGFRRKCRHIEGVKAQ